MRHTASVPLTFLRMCHFALDTEPWQETSGKTINALHVAKSSVRAPWQIEHLQCRAQRCRRKMLDGLLPKLSSAVVTAADDFDRTARSARKLGSFDWCPRAPWSFDVHTRWSREHLQHVMNPSLMSLFQFLFLVAVLAATLARVTPRLLSMVSLSLSFACEPHTSVVQPSSLRVAVLGDFVCGAAVTREKVH